MHSEYRQRFDQYHTDLHREDYLFRSGRKKTRETRHIRREYGDLFELSMIGELREALKEVPEYRENEVTSVKRLVAFAIEGNLARSVEEISEQIEDCENSSRIDWDGRKIGLDLSAEIIAGEPDGSRRRDLYSRRADLIKGAQYLRGELIETLHSGARAHGYDNYLEMNRRLRGVGAEPGADKMARFLSATESDYSAALAPLLASQAGSSIDEATPADLCYLRCFTRFDHLFPRDRMLDVYRELFAGLGFRVEKQENVEIDTQPRPGKEPRAFCSPIRIPDEIKLVLDLNGGQANHREFFREAGRAQNFAWTSRNLYPEFRMRGDAAVPEAWGILLENLMFDEDWLLEMFGIIESEQFRQTLGFFRLMDARANAAKSIYEIDLHSGRISGAAGDRYVELMTDAMRVRFDDAEHLDTIERPFYPSVFMRASAFELLMREYLKTRFGRRWWTSRKAGEMLIDLWNTGQRYTAEELASVIGLGEFDYTGLAVDLLRRIEK